VADIFIKILKGTPEYNKKDYVQALDITFMKIDDMIDNPEEGHKILREIRRKNGSMGDGSSSVSTAVGNGTGCTANVVLITP
jgi:hypothetical protein